SDLAGDRAAVHGQVEPLGGQRRAEREEDSEGSHGERSEPAWSPTEGLARSPRSGSTRAFRGGERRGPYGGARSRSPGTRNSPTPGLGLGRRSSADAPQTGPAAVRPSRQARRSHIIARSTSRGPVTGISTNSRECGSTSSGWRLAPWIFNASTTCGGASRTTTPFLPR